MRQRKGLNISKHDVTALELNSMGWGLRCVPAFRILFASSTVPGLIPALHCSQTRRLRAVAAEWLGLSPFPWWCGTPVITLSVVEGTSALSMGIWSKSLAWLLGALRPAGGGDPVSQGRLMWFGVMCWVLWCDEPLGVVWWAGQHALAQPVLTSPATCKVWPEWERVGGRVCLTRLPWVPQGWGNAAGFKGIHVTRAADTNKYTDLCADGSDRCPASSEPSTLACLTEMQWGNSAHPIVVSVHPHAPYAEFFHKGWLSGCIWSQFKTVARTLIFHIHC